MNPSTASFFCSQYAFNEIRRYADIKSPVCFGGQNVNVKFFLLHYPKSGSPHKAGMTRKELTNRVAVAGAVMAGDVVFELAFDVAEQGGRAEAEQFRLQPVAAQLVLHQGLVNQRVFGL